MAENFGALISEIEKLENSVLANNLKELENTLAGINDNDFRFVNGLELLTSLIIDKNVSEDDGTFNTFDDKMSRIENFASVENLSIIFSNFTCVCNRHAICAALTRLKTIYDDLCSGNWTERNNYLKIQNSVCNSLIASSAIVDKGGTLTEKLAKLNISNHIFDSSTFSDGVENKNAYLCISARELPYTMPKAVDIKGFLEQIFSNQNLEFVVSEDKITDEIKTQFERYKDFFASVADKVEKHLDALDDTIAKNKNDFKSFSEDDMAVVLNAMSFNNTIKKLIRERRAIHNQNTSREIKRIMNYILDQIVE